jgi:hypothetical protein
LTAHSPVTLTVPLRPWVEVLQEAEVDPQKFQSVLADAPAGVRVRTARPVTPAARVLLALFMAVSFSW